MLIKRTIPLLIILVGGYIGLYRSQNPCIESSDYTLQHAWQGGFAIKIERVPERCSFFNTSAVNFVVSSGHDNSDDWQKITTVHSDHMMDIPPDAIAFKSEKVATVSLIDMNLTIADEGNSVKVDFGTPK